MSRRNILYVAYPLLPVTPQSAGGAEQVLAMLEAEASAEGYDTATAACAGSVLHGELFGTTMPALGRLDSARSHEFEHHARTLKLISDRKAVGRPFELVHDHSGSFFTCGDRVNAPLLATLHLPRSFYPQDSFTCLPANVHFNCVSESQAGSFEGLQNLMGVVPNGIDLSCFAFQSAKKDYLLWLGRICEEKGTHLALDVAAKTGLPIVVAGQVYPFHYHHAYFEDEVKSRLRRMGALARFVPRPTSEQKLHLLQNARAVLITSAAAETSSLVAMEAAACGTPTIVFNRGALPEVVRADVTGFVVRDVGEMAGAIANVGDIRAKSCRAYAEEHFSSQRMAHQYFNLYERLVGEIRTGAAPSEIATVTGSTSDEASPQNVKSGDSGNVTAS